MNNWQWGPWVKLDEHNPCLLPQQSSTFQCPLNGEVHWEEKDVFNPAAVVKDGKVYLLYRAEDNVGRYYGTSRIGLAVSEDGRTFSRSNNPVLYPEYDEWQSIEWEGGCEDPRIVETADGSYVLTYTAFDGHLPRLCIATSTDLIDWHKHGPAFGKAQGGKYRDMWSKAGAIVCRLEEERIVAAQVNGCYWMYWGESNIYAATSHNLIDWTPVERPSEGVRLLHVDDVIGSSLDEPGEPFLAPVMTVRRNRFDSRLIEPGPPAILTDNGIVLMYNSSNSLELGDATLADKSYYAGQVLLDTADPTVVIARSTEPFFGPEKDYELQGQFNHCCFLQGMVRFKGEWLLYYGTADSKIAVAAYR